MRTEEERKKKDEKIKVGKEGWIGNEGRKEKDDEIKREMEGWKGNERRDS